MKQAQQPWAAGAVPCDRHVCPFAVRKHTWRVIWEVGHWRQCPGQSDCRLFGTTPCIIHPSMVISPRHPTNNVLPRWMLLGEQVANDRSLECSPSDADYRKLGYESQVLGVRGGREALSSLLKSSGGNRWSLLNAGEDRAEVSRPSSLRSLQVGILISLSIF